MSASDMAEGRLEGVVLKDRHGSYPERVAARVVEGQGSVLARAGGLAVRSPTIGMHRVETGSLGHNAASTRAGRRNRASAADSPVTGRWPDGLPAPPPDVHGRRSSATA
jgi:hypothetical protein